MQSTCRICITRTGRAPWDRRKARQYPKESNTAESMCVNMQLPDTMFAESWGAHGKDWLCVIYEYTEDSTKMRGQHLASISDSAKDTLAASPETVKLWVLNCWEKLACGFLCPWEQRDNFATFFFFSSFCNCHHCPPFLFGIWPSAFGTIWGLKWGLALWLGDPKLFPPCSE